MGRILDRYLLRSLVPAFLFGVTGFVFFFMIFNVFEKIDVFVDNHTPLHLILRYYMSGMAYNAILVSPMAMLLTTFIVLGQMTRHNELTAMKTAGLSLYRVFLPVYLFALVVSAGVFLLADRVMPGAKKMEYKIYNEQIRGRMPRQFGVKLNVNHLGEGGRVYAIRRYDVRRRQMQDVVIQEFDGGRLKRRVDAHSADWLGDAWLFRQGVVRTFHGDGETAAPFDSLVFPEFKDRPEDLAKDEVNPDQMNYADLGRYVARLRESGRPAQLYSTEEHLKLAFPLGNVLAVLIAAPLAARLRRGGVAIGFAMSFGLFMAYMGLVQFGRVLGHAGQIPPWPAAWLANLVFAAAGGVLMLKAPK